MRQENAAIPGVVNRAAGTDMINGQTVLAIIPCRSGSKRVPGKNFRPFRGRPLYEWTLEQARLSRYIDTLYVSRDEDRPAELCTDTATSEDVMRHHQAAHPHHWIVLLQPTSPLRTAEDIDACIERAQLGQGCISVAFSTGKTNGAIYVCTAEYLAAHDFTYGALMKYVMPDDRSLDIDEEHQFHA